MRYLTFIAVFFVSILGAENSWSQGNQHFTTTFYQRVQGEPNFVFSPLSLQMALGMAAELALNETQKEILDTIGLPLEENERGFGARALISNLNGKMRIASGIWLADTLTFSPHYPSIFKESYLSDLKSADFSNAPELARDELNHFVSEKTQGEIQELFPQGSIQPLTKFVLVNALYLKAPWAIPFSPEMTYEAPFYGLEKSLRPLPYLRNTASFGLLEEANCSVLEIPFKQELSLFVVLPHEGVSLHEVEETLTTRRLAHFIQDMNWEKIDLSLPKFKVSTSLQPKDLLIEMGIKKAFSSFAEFDLGTENESVAISNIFHKAIFEVNEDGGKGSAATGVVGTTRYKSLNPFIPPRTIVVNRPFIFFVVDKTTDVVLFSGRIQQPKL